MKDEASAFFPFVAQSLCFLVGKRHNKGAEEMLEWSLHIYQTFSPQKEKISMANNTSSLQIYQLHTSQNMRYRVIETDTSIIFSWLLFFFFADLSYHSVKSPPIPIPIPTLKSLSYSYSICSTGIVSTLTIKIKSQLNLPNFT